MVGLLSSRSSNGSFRAKQYVLDVRGIMIVWHPGYIEWPHHLSSASWLTLIILTCSTRTANRIKREKNGSQRESVSYDLSMSRKDKRLWHATRKDLGIRCHSELIPCFNRSKFSKTGEHSGTARLKLIESNRQCTKCVATWISHVLDSELLLYLPEVERQVCPMDPEMWSVFHTIDNDKDRDGNPRIGLLARLWNTSWALCYERMAVLSNIHRHQKMIAGTLTPHAFTITTNLFSREYATAGKDCQNQAEKLLFLRLRCSSQFDRKRWKRCGFKIIALCARTFTILCLPKMRRR